MPGLTTPRNRSPPIHRQRPTSLLRRTARVIGAVLTTVTAAAMLAVAVAVFWFHLAMQPVLSASMRPTFGPGAALFTRNVPASEVRPGDVIIFRPPNGSAGFAHRVASVSGDPRRPVITTKGDANTAPDPWKVQLADDAVPIVIGSVPELGRVMTAAKGAGPRSALALFSGLVFLVLGTRSILGPRPSSPPVRLRQTHPA